MSTAPRPATVRRMATVLRMATVRRMATVIGVAAVLAGCGSLGRVSGIATTAAPTTTGPPPGASQAPGPPLATASSGVPGALDSHDPRSVAAVCFARWQSFDARADDPGAGVRRARACMTADFYDTLGGGASQPPTRAWADLAAKQTRSTVTVLAVSYLGTDTSATGRVMLLLNVRRTTTATGSAPVVSISTPALTLLRQPDGTWQLAGADLSNTYGQAPGR
jgi:hypothetical protein